MKTLLAIIGVIALANGLLWMAQGLGYVNWPRESFMISEIRWVYYGGITAVVGLGLIVWSRR